MGWIIVGDPWATTRVTLAHIRRRLQSQYLYLMCLCQSVKRFVRGTFHCGCLSCHYHEVEDGFTGRGDRPVP